MVDILVDGLTFTFPDSWRVSKYDEWVFYRKQFSKMWGGIKAVDLLAIDDQVVWLIEVKDYRRERRTKELSIPDEIAKKVFSTIAAILPAKANASTIDEQNFAKELVKANQLRVVLHLEQPPKT